MSRIYEALKLAESERTSQESLRPPAQEPAQLSAQPVPAPVPASAHSSPSQNVAVAASASVTFNEFGSRQTKWTPVVNSLPSLWKRGADVEQFRTLRSRLQEFRGQTRQLKSILISSGLPQEGKSYIAANLALSLARHKNSKVLLIDGDMRRSTLHKLLGVDGGLGLVDYLSGSADLTQVIQQALLPPELPPLHRQAFSNLAFIGGGTCGDLAADLSGSPRFQQLISTASTTYDWVIVDSSPVIPVSDAVNLARSCDGVLLVARGGVTRFQTAQQAVNQLKSTHLLGFVLNGVKHSPATSSYYGYDTLET